MAGFGELATCVLLVGDFFGTSAVWWFPDSDYSKCWCVASLLFLEFLLIVVVFVDVAGLVLVFFELLCIGGHVRWMW